MADGAAAPTAPTEPFLGVGRSLSNRVWRERPADEAVIRAHMLRLELIEPLARALASRGINEAQAADYLTPTLRALFPDPSCFADMDKAVDILLDALVNDRKTVIFADYDVDG